MPYTVYPARRAPAHAGLRPVWDFLWQFRQILGLGSGSLALVLVVSGWAGSFGTSFAGASSSGQVQPDGTPASWLQGATLLTVYGRGFHTAPVLGRLGLAGDFDVLNRQIGGARAEIGRLTGHRPVRMALHLIYGMAAPCEGPADTCLVYLDDETGVDLVHDYILPAQQRGWLVILDDQLGRSSPAAEIARLRAKGYLAYDNVEVAFDPEFHTTAGQTTPGSPTGQVTAGEINNAERALQRAVTGDELAHRKLLLIHQWTPSMILDRKRMLTSLQDVQPAVIMDGIGPADEKAAAYNTLMSGELPDGALPGIKLFLPSPYALPGGVDAPALSWPQILGRDAVTSANGIQNVVRPVPRIVVIS